MKTLGNHLVHTRYTIQARFVWVPMSFAILVTTMIIGMVAADILVDVVTRPG